MPRLSLGARRALWVVVAFLVAWGLASWFNRAGKGAGSPADEFITPKTSP
jgi:hypothetical protein